MPVSQRLKDRSAAGDAIFICLVAGIGFALIPAAVVGYIVMERQKGLKHMQIVSGMNLFAYWSANFTFDLIKSVLPCALIIASLYIFDMGYEDCWVTILMFPFGVVPFSYMVSTCFSEESTASTTVLFVNLVAGAIGGMASFILRIIPDTYQIGDSTAAWLRVIPVYAISNSIIYDGSKNSFNSSRSFRQEDDPSVPSITLEPYDYKNIGGDIAAMWWHFLVGMIVLLMVEMGAFSWIRLTGKGVKRIAVKDPDDDVIQEEDRV
jgi:hypothetical protein